MWDLLLEAIWWTLGAIGGVAAIVIAMAVRMQRALKLTLPRETADLCERQRGAVVRDAAAVAPLPAIPQLAKHNAAAR